MKFANSTSCRDSSTLLRKATIEKVSAEANRVFEDPEKARAWLNQVNLVLGHTPMSVLGTVEGTNEVMKILSSIATGGVV